VVTTPIELNGQVPSSTEGWAEGKALVLRFKGGDTAAYDAIYDRYQARVTGICRRMLIDPHDVQEASQEAFLRVYQALGRFNGRYELGAWIARITTNVCLDNLRSRSRRPKEMAPLEAIDLELALETKIETPEDLVIRNSEGRRVRKLLATLPPLHRAAIVLRDFEGLSYAEVAGALQITEPQVKALLHRARQKFKRDWSSLASIFLPVRLLQRFKDVPATSVEQAAYSSSAAAPQLAVSCGTILQHCGQFFAERVGPALVGGALAVAGIGTAAAGPNEVIVRVATEEASLPAISGKLPIDSRIEEKAIHTRTKKKDDHSSPAEAPAVTPVAEPTASPSPDPVPTDAPPAEDGGEDPSSPPPGDGSHSPGDEPSPEPPPFAPAMGFGSTRSAPAAWNHVEVNCDAGTVHQDLDASFAHGDKTYPVSLDLDAAGDVRFNLLVYPDGEKGADVEYSATGSQMSAARDGSKLTLEYSGNYANTDYDAEWKELPEKGSFHLTIELDCAASAVAAETLLLSAE
jgi:RNA polymerase sigma-70 factor (ECF subfamily)